MTGQNHALSEKALRAAALAKQAAAGDEDAFSLLAELFSPEIGRVLSSLSIPDEEKEDLKQEALLGLYKAVLLFDPEISAFTTFGSVCIRSAVSDGLRRYNRGSASTPLCDEDPDSIPAEESLNPERILMGKEELTTLLRRSDALLSPLERRIFGMYLGGKSGEEIAVLLGKEAKSIHNALYRIRRKLSGLSAR